MFEELVVRFTNDNGRREVVIPAGTDIEAVFFPGHPSPETMQALGLERAAGPAPGMTLRDENGEVMGAAALGSEEGPGFCCIKNGKLFCW